MESGKARLNGDTKPEADSGEVVPRCESKTVSLKKP